MLGIRTSRFFSVLDFRCAWLFSNAFFFFFVILVRYDTGYDTGHDTGI